MRLLPKVLMSFSALALLPSAAAAQEARPFATIFKNPQCGCCESYGDYLEASGYEVKMVATHDLALIKERQGVPAGLEGCHKIVSVTIIIDINDFSTQIMISFFGPRFSRDFRANFAKTDFQIEVHLINSRRIENT